MGGCRNRILKVRVRKSLCCGQSFSGVELQQAFQQVDSCAVEINS